MKIIIPLDYNNIESIGSAFNTENYPDWASGVSYQQDTVVVNTGGSSPASLSQEWYCVAPHTSTTLDAPGTVNGENFWTSLGYSNRYAAFDRTTTKKSILNTNRELYQIVLKLGKYVNSVVLLNSEIGKSQIKNWVYGVSTPKNIFTNYSLDENSGWFNYVETEPNSRYQPFIVTNIDNSFSQSTGEKQLIEVDVFKPKNILDQNIYDSGSIGEIILGNLFEVGWTQRGISSGITDYSIKEQDIFGNTTFVERNFTKTINCQVLVQNKYLNSIQRVFYSLRAKPCVWIPTSDENLTESTIIYGYYKSFSLELSYPEYSIYNIEIEGLV